MAWTEWIGFVISFLALIFLSFYRKPSMQEEPIEETIVPKPPQMPKKSLHVQPIVKKSKAKSSIVPKKEIVEEKIVQPPRIMRLMQKLPHVRYMMIYQEIMGKPKGWL